MILGLICARKGSKGLPGKNERHMGGMALLDLAAYKAERSDAIGPIFVSTDIRLVNMRDVIKRPPHLAGDRTPKWTVWQHAVQQYHAITGVMPDAIVDIDVTRPLTTPADIDAVITAWKSAPGNAVMAIAPAKTNPWFDIVAPRWSNGRLTPIGDHRYNARQDAPVAYQHGGIYCIETQTLLDGACMWDATWTGCEIPREHTLDIDDELDWRIVEHLMRDRDRVASDV